MVSSGPKALLMVISPSAAIARTPNKKHIAAINAKVASLVGGLTTLSISLSFRPARMVEPTNPSRAAAKTIAHKTPLHCGISNPSMSGLGQSVVVSQVHASFYFRFAPETGRKFKAWRPRQRGDFTDAELDALFRRRLKYQQSMPRGGALAKSGTRPFGQ